MQAKGELSNIWLGVYTRKKIRHFTFILHSKFKLLSLIQNSNYTVVNCGPLTDPIRGSILISMTDYEGQAIYSCDSGYQLETGASTITRTCELNGMWSGDVPQCVRKYKI